MQVLVATDDNEVISSTRSGGGFAIPCLLLIDEILKVGSTSCNACHDLKYLLSFQDTFSHQYETVCALLGILCDWRCHDSCAWLLTKQFGLLSVCCASG